MAKRGFWHELKRRHVYRVAVAYAVAGWLLIEVATQVFPVFHMPDWADQLVVLLIVIGFPIAVILAWAFEVIPEGVRRTEPMNSEDARPPDQTHHVGKRLNAIIIGVLVLAVAVLLWRELAPSNKHAAAAPAIAAAAQGKADNATAKRAANAIPAKSIAVLPFENLSNDKNNEYFVAGMQGLILTKLASIGDLKVISRTSTLHYASRPDDLKTIAQQLGVATVLEGSVQKAGDHVLISVQLIDTRSDSHIWAQSYTRTLKNVFGVEGDVAEQIAQALKARLSPAESKRLATALSNNPAANDLYLRAEYFSNQGLINYDTASMKAAIPLYRQAIAKATNFALARARLSYTESALAWFGGGSDTKQLYADARAQAEQALALQPDLAAAHLAIGYSDYWGRGDYAGALTAFAAALKLQPNDADALLARGYVLRRQGHFDAAIAVLHQVLARDPRNTSLTFELGGTYMLVSRYPEAEAALQHALALDPHNVNAKLYYSSAILYANGDVARALAAAQGDASQLQLQRVRLLTYQRQYRAALALLASIPDTPDNFSFIRGFKQQQQANLYRLAGDGARARPLYAQALPLARAQLKAQTGSAIKLSLVWHSIADAELGLGHTAVALAAVAQSLALITRSGDHFYGPGVIEFNASLYAEANRADLAVPLLAKTLASSGIGYFYAPVLLWLDPAWDPIRHDSRFQALLKKYAKYKPATTPAAAAPAAATSASTP